MRRAGRIALLVAGAITDAVFASIIDWNDHHIWRGSVNHAHIYGSSVTINRNPIMTDLNHTPGNRWGPGGWAERGGRSGSGGRDRR